MPREAFAVGDELRIVADQDIMVPDIRAFACITGNRIVEA